MSPGHSQESSFDKSGVAPFSEQSFETQLPREFDRLAMIGNDNRVLDAMLKPISESWKNLKPENKLRISRLMGDVYSAIENYQGKYRRYDVAAKYRRSGDEDEISGFSNSDQLRHSAHQRIFDALNELSRAMKEMGLSNAWRSRDAIFSPPVEGDYGAMMSKIGSWALQLDLGDGSIAEH